jgi:hypothetical protein
VNATEAPSCPSCGWPAGAEPQAASRHGGTSYLRCVCGLWLLLRDDVLVTTAGRSAFA